ALFPDAFTHHAGAHHRHLLVSADLHPASDRVRHLFHVALVDIGRARNSFAHLAVVRHPARSRLARHLNAGQPRQAARMANRLAALTIVSLANLLANLAANRLAAGLVHRLAHGLAARLVARLADWVANGVAAGLHVRLAHRLAYGVANNLIAGFRHAPVA